MKTIYFITHPEVVIDPTVPVPDWPLSERGINRMKQLLTQPWVKDVRAIYCSTEQKAIDGARILADHLALSYEMREDLGENDRSATGYLPKEEFEATADQFFAQPDQSVRGWETATAAQQRLVNGMNAIIDSGLWPVSPPRHTGHGRRPARAPKFLRRYELDIINHLLGKNV